MLKQLRLKFIVVTMAIVCVMLVVIFSLIYYFTRINLENQSISILQTIAESTDQQGVGTSHWADVPLPYFTVQINIWGDVLAAGSDRFDLENQQFLQEMIQQVYDRNETAGVLEDRALRYQVSSWPGTRKITFVDISTQQATLQQLVQTSILTGLLSTGLFLAVVILLARWAVRPVEKAWQQQRQFVSDASHELKTPLTVIMSNAELLQSEGDTPQNRQQFYQNILTMSQQMRHLVEGLLELARADNGQVRNSFETVALSELIEQAVLPFEPVLYERGLLLESRIQPGIRVTGNGQYLRQVAEILLDNAAKYSVPGTVQLSLQKQGRYQCLLCVENPGLPIAPEERERIFERFYRADQARSRDGSFGLGLSIAKSVVQEHGGKIWVEGTQAGNRFCIQLSTISR